MERSIKYIEIKEDLLRKINEGQYGPGDRLPSEHELAVLHQVSVITTKKALDELETEGYIKRIRGSGSFVSERRKTAASFQGNSISVLLPFGSGTGGGMEILDGIETTANSRGHYVTVMNTHRNCTKEREIIQQLLADRVRGIIFYPSYSSENFELIRKLSMERYPIVLIDKSIYDIDIDTVTCDNRGASYMMTRYLIENGHRSIAFVSERAIDDISSIRERFLGYSDGLSEADIALDVERIMHPNTRYHQNADPKKKAAFCREVAMKIQMKRTITAVQVASDEFAIELINQCKEIGLKVPEDISIVGFDDLEIASHITPPLTTVRQEFRTIGKRSAELLFRRLDEPGRNPEKILIPTRIVPRGSCRSIRVTS